MLEIKNVRKAYHNTIALSNINLTLDEGIYALLGPNGAGKSTLMNILCDQLKMDEGEILWKHQNIYQLKKSYFDILGYAPQQQGLYDEFSGKRFLTYMALLKNIPKKEIASEVERVARLVNMEDELWKKCKAYSGGMKQRMLVAQALLGHPALLLFDEPTSALDPETIGDVLAVMQNLAKEGMNMVVVTHEMGFAREVADRIIFMAEGEILVDTTDVQGFFDNPTEPRAKQFLSKVINHTSDTVSQK